MWKKTFTLLSILSLLLVVTACKPNRPKGCPKLYRCAVRILQEGEPLPGALVSFIPEDDNLKKYTINALTDNEGLVTLKTQMFFGAPLGKYKVTVAKSENLIGNVLIGEPPTTIPHVEPELGDPETTTLSIEVIKKQKEPEVVEVGPDPSA